MTNKSVALFLRNNGLEQYQRRFDEIKIDDKSFQALTQEIVNSLVQPENQDKFKQGWLATFGTPLPSCSNEVVLVNVNLQNTENSDPNSEPLKFAIQESLKVYICKDYLLYIRKANSTTGLILENYGTEKCLSSSDATKVCKTIIEALLDINFDYWVKEHWNRVANNLAERTGIFAEESPETHYKPSKPGQSASGKLINAHENLRQDRRKRRGEVKSRKGVDTEDDNPPQPEVPEELKTIIELLQHHQLPIPQINSHLKSTAKF